MERRSTVVLVSVFAVAALVAAVVIGMSIYNSSAVSYDRVLSQYLKAQASGDKDTMQSLTSDGFINELSDAALAPGEFRAYDFGFQGTPTADAATLHFAVITLGGENEAAYLADAVFKKQGFKHVLTAIRKTSKGKPLVE